MNDPAPLYVKVKRHITDAISAGQYLPGAKLPSESDLVEALDVSRMTVNRALRELTRDGLITRLQGVGSFVSSARPMTSLVELKDIRDFVLEQGADYSCKVLSAERRLATRRVSELLEVKRGSQILHVAILHYSDGAPMQLERRFVREDFSPDLLKQDLQATSTFRYFQSIAPVSELEQVVEACTPDAQERRWLKLEEGQPLLKIRRRTWVGPRIVTLGYFSHPGDQFRVTVRLCPGDLVR